MNGSGRSLLRTYGPLVLVVGLVLLVALAAVGAGTGTAVHRSGGQPTGPQQPPACHLATCQQGSPPPSADSTPHPLLTGPFYLAVGIGLAVLVGLLLLMLVGTILGGGSLGSLLAGLRPSRRAGLEREVADDELGPDAVASAALAAAVDAGLTGLSANADPRSAVIGCWVALERAAAGAGLARRDAETSAELAARLLTASRVRPDVVQGLSALYREARFSSHEVDGSMRDRAVTLLGQVQDQLASSAAPGA